MAVAFQIPTCPGLPRSNPDLFQLPWPKHSRPLRTDASGPKPRSEVSVSFGEFCAGKIPSPPSASGIFFWKFDQLSKFYPKVDNFSWRLPSDHLTMVFFPKFFGFFNGRLEKAFRCKGLTKSQRHAAGGHIPRKKTGKLTYATLFCVVFL